MNITDRLVSPTNTSKIEYIFDKPVSSSDLNETQVVNAYNNAIKNYLTGSPIQLQWYKESDTSICITAMNVDIVCEYDINGDEEPELVILTNGNPEFTDSIIVNARQSVSSNKYKLNVFFRFREVDKDSQLYKNGIRTNNRCTITGADIPIENVIEDEYLNEEISTRVIFEYTFILDRVSSSVTPVVPSGEPEWIKLEDIENSNLRPVSRDFTIDLSYNKGMIGLVNEGSAVMDYALVNDSVVRDLPIGTIGESCYDVNENIIYQSTNYGTWTYRNDNLEDYIKGLNSFIRVNHFVDHRIKIASEYTEYKNHLRGAFQISMDQDLMPGTYYIYVIGNSDSYTDINFNSDNGNTITVRTNPFQVIANSATASIATKFLNSYYGTLEVSELLHLSSINFELADFYSIIITDHSLVTIEKSVYNIYPDDVVEDSTQYYLINDLHGESIYLDNTNSIDGKSGYILWHNANGFLTHRILLDKVQGDNINEIRLVLSTLDKRTANIYRTMTKSFQWRGYLESTKNLNDYRGSDSIGYWSCQTSASQPQGLPISRVANERLTLLVYGIPSSTVDSGYVQELYYTNQNKLFRRYYSSDKVWSSWYNYAPIDSPTFTGTVTIAGAVAHGTNLEIESGYSNLIHNTTLYGGTGYLILRGRDCSVTRPSSPASQGYATHALISCSDVDIEGANDYTLINVKNYTLSEATDRHSDCVAINSTNPSLYRHNVVIGNYNTVTPAETDLFIIGNGSSQARSNAFRVTDSGQVYCSGGYNSTGADYAEYFEWVDGNPENQDRRGLFVALHEDKVKIAEQGDDVIGVISASPCIIGNTYDDVWHGMYLTDVFGQILTETVQDEKGYEVERPILNPQYDPDSDYIPRSKRPEWAVVGLFGQLIVIDDSSCVVGGHCICANGGIATKSDVGYRVLKRLDNNHVKILFTM